MGAFLLWCSQLVGAQFHPSVGSKVGSKPEASRSLVPMISELSRLWRYRVVVSAWPLSLSRPLGAMLGLSWSGLPLASRRVRLETAGH